MSARNSALAVSARRALWLKAWSGDAAFKSRLCSLPVQDDLLFGPELDSVLERTSDKKKMFPEVKKAGVKHKARSYSGKLRKVGGRVAFCFTLLQAPTGPSDSLAAVGGRLKAFLPQWQDLGPNHFILSIIEREYSLEFCSPPSSEVSDHRSSKGPREGQSSDHVVGGTFSIKSC